MTSESSRRLGQRVLDIGIAALLGAVFAWWFHPDALIVDRLHAKTILVDGSEGTVSMDGDHGITLNRDDYTEALLWFREPGTGYPATGGPVLWISGKESKAFKVTPSGPEVVHFKQDEKDGR
jgi:hypothetical protein